MNPQSKVRAYAVGAALSAVAGLLFADWGTPRLWAIPALALATLLGEIAVVHLNFGRQRYSFSCTEGVIGASLVAATGSWMIVAVALGAFAAQYMRHQPKLKLWFNVAQFSAGVAAAVAMSSALDSGLLGATAGMGVFWFVNHALVCAAIAATAGKRFLSMVWASAPLGALHSSGNTSVGLLAGWLAFNAPLGLLGLIVPMGLLWFSYDQQTARAAEATLFAELARGQERVTGQSIDISAQVVLSAAARLFGGADVELILNGADGPVRYVGDEYGVPERQRVDPTAFDQEWVMRALSASQVVTGVAAGRPYCSMVLGADDSPLAVINAQRPLGAATFGRREVSLASVLVGQAEAWLSVADLTASRDAAVDRAAAAGEAARALGDIGAETSANLVMLRESASRLARLATPGRTELDPRGVHEIVDELHSVERAVASLLGAIALAAEPDLTGAAAAMGDLPMARRPVDAEWTTTGVLVELG
ncbi:MAG: hypothetical protein ABIM89_11180 [Mycobacteriales bacterium]